MGKRLEDLKPISLNQLERSLKEEFYGISDLVRLKVFPVYSQARKCIRNGEISFFKVNGCMLLVTKEELIKYLKKHRGPEMKQFTFKCTMEEAEVVDKIVEGVKEHSPDFSAEDLFRNCIQELGRHPFVYDKTRLIYKTNRG